MKDQEVKKPKENEKPTWVDDTDKDDWIDTEYPGVYEENK